MVVSRSKGMVGEWLRKNLSLCELMAWRDKPTPLQRQVWEGLNFMIQPESSDKDRRPTCSTLNNK